MLNKIAHLCSIIFHPVFNLLYVITAVIAIIPGAIFNDQIQGFTFLLVLLSGTAILPVAGTLILTGNFELNKRNERALPYLVTAFCFTLTYFYISNVSIYAFVKVYILSLIAGLLLLFLVNLKFKISMHSASAGSALALFVKLYLMMPGYFYEPLLAMILIAGIIGTSRLKLNAHTNAELYSGYLLGFMVTWLFL